MLGTNFCLTYWRLIYKVAMDIQFKFSNIINDFLQNRECMQAFLNATKVDELQELGNLHGDLFVNDVVAVRSQQGSDKIDGFVISSERKKIYVISPCYDYLKFWGWRNFFTWRLAKNHDNVNDGIERHVINILPQENRNKTVQFDIVKKCYIHNIFINNISDELKEWLDALYN